MKIEHLNTFIIEFFESQGCEVKVVEEHLIDIKLNKELDIALMNRPFYWHYMDKLGKQGEPMSLYLYTGDKRDELNREWIHFGSPRLHQLFNYIQTKSKVSILYEQTDGNSQTALYPWLIMNCKIKIIGKQSKDIVGSYGLHLLNGMMCQNMMKQLQERTLQRIMTDYSFTISPIITPTSGFHRLFHYIENQIIQDDLTWATKSQDAYDEEVSLINHFYEQQSDIGIEWYNNELEKLEERLKPRVDVSIINAGIFYLTNDFQPS